MSTMTVFPTTSGTTPVVRAGRDHGTAGQIRLTRRGRLFVFLAALAFTLILGVLWGAGSVATERPGTPEPTRVVMVGTGDTLWGIAAEVTVDGDVGDMVERIQRLNALDSGMVTAGQKLRVPK